MDHACVALEAAADEVVESDGVANLEAFALSSRIHGLDVSYTFMAECDRVVWPPFIYQVRVTQRGGLYLDEELAGARGGFGDVIDDNFLLFPMSLMSALILKVGSENAEGKQTIQRIEERQGPSLTIGQTVTRGRM